jgi:hypothetical protein
MYTPGSNNIFETMLKSKRTAHIWRYYSHEKQPDYYSWKENSRGRLFLSTQLSVQSVSHTRWKWKLCIYGQPLHKKSF